MGKVNRFVASIMASALAVGITSANGVAQTRANVSDDKSVSCSKPFDPVAFIKCFQIGMSYVEVQAALPKNAEQDTLAYVPGEDSFLLGVDMTSEPAWSASFKFDTLDTPARRPEQLIEFSCTASVSTRSESFETIVRKVTAAFGEPVELDRSRETFQQAGWRVTGGSVLTLEYSKTPGATADNVNIDFVIKKKPRPSLPDSKAVA